MKIRMKNTGKIAHVTDALGNALIHAKRATAVTEGPQEKPLNFKRTLPTSQPTYSTKKSDADKVEDADGEDAEKDTVEENAKAALTTEKDLVAAGDSGEEKKTRGRPKKQTYQTKDITAGE